MRVEFTIRARLLRLNHLGARSLRRLRPYYVSVILAAVSATRVAFPRKRKGSATPDQILVIRLDAIGDLVMSTLIFRELKQRFPTAKITAVAQNQGRNLIETNPFIDRIVSPRPVSKMRLLHRFRQDWAMLQMYLKELRREDFRLVVNPRPGHDTYSADVLMALVDCPQSFKYKDSSMKGLAQSVREFAFRRTTQLPTKPAQHEVVSNMVMTEKLTGRQCLSRPEIFLTDDDLRSARAQIQSAPAGAIIVSVAFTAQAKKRAWPLASWSGVLSRLSEDRPIFAFLICAGSEEAIGKKLAADLSIPSKLISGASLRHVAAILQQSNLFIGPDSGLAHIAAAMDCPAVVVSPHPMDGDPDHGNSPLRFGPFSKRSRVIQPLHAMPPCADGCDAVDPHCILQVEVPQVLAACQALLSEDHEIVQTQQEITPSAMSLQ